MASQLKNLIQFVSVPVGVPTTLPHGITIPGKGSVRPDLVTILGPKAQQFPRDQVTTTDTSITVVNAGPIETNVNLLVEYWYSYERAFGGAPTDELQATSLVLSGADGSAPHPGPGTREIYYRTNGSDATGDGSLANPYATFLRAKEDLLLDAEGLVQIIDGTGTGIQSNPGGYTIPPVQSNDEFTPAVLPFLGFPLNGPLVLRATPTTLLNMTAPDIASQNMDPVSGFVAIASVSGTFFGPGNDLYRGKMVIDSVGLFGAILASQPGGIRVAQPLAFTPPLQIVEPSAGLGNSDAGSSTPTLTFGSGCRVIIDGYTITNAGPTIPGIQADVVPDLLMNFDQVQGLYVSETTTETAAVVLEPGGDLIIVGGITTWSGSFFDTVDRINKVGCVSEGVLALGMTACDPWGASGITTVLSSEYDFMEITSPNNINSGAGIVMHTGSLRARHVKIANAPGDGIYCNGPGRLELSDVADGGGIIGVGLKLLDGAHAAAPVATVTISGAGGCYQVGGQAAAGAWGAAGNVPDFAGADADGSRLLKT